jgi:hypothetical protein
MSYTTIDDPTIYFNTVLYAGDDSTSNAITGVNFQPDWVWLKNRSAETSQLFQDSVRGKSGSNYLYIQANDTAAEAAQGDNDGLNTIGADGFTVGFTNSTGWNKSGNNYASWNWKAGTTASGSTSGSGTAKTYNSSTSTASGFSIVKYVGNATANHQFPHGLGVKPDMVFIKNLDDATTNWQGYNKDLTATKSFKLNSSDQPATTASVTNNVEPTTTVFNLGSAADANANDQEHIAYCFASIKGYSKIGTYTGNGSTDGAFVYTGFKPAWLLTKRTDSSTSGNWNVSDNKRDPSNVVTQILFADDAQSEITASNVYDYYSNGFKVRESGAGTNASGSVYMYMAFAESPFVNSNKVPNNAR